LPIFVGRHTPATTEADSPPRGPPQPIHGVLMSFLDMFQAFPIRRETKTPIASSRRIT